MVEKLLKAGAEPNPRLPSTGETPLMTAALAGNEDAVKSLLAHGAEVNAKENRRGQTSLMWAIEEKHPEVVRVLVEHGADVRARSKGGFTPLLFAARQGDMDVARMLVAAGANVNDYTPEDGNVLVVASASGHEALSLFLLEHGADANAADAYGFTPLHNAMQKGISDLSAVPYISSTGPSSNMPELAKALLAHGAHPNARTLKDYPARSRSPFRLSGRPAWQAQRPFSSRQPPAMLRLLAAGGADPLLGLKNNTTPLMAAGINRVQDFRDGEEKNALEAVKLAVELGADVKAANSIGQTALHAAASTGVNAIVQFLADKGAKVDAHGKAGQTPWTIAEAISPDLNAAGALRLHKSTADLLLQLGATTVEPSRMQDSDAAQKRSRAKLAADLKEQ